MGKKESTEYKINDQQYITVEKIDPSGERIFVTAIPKSNEESVRTATILDKPEAVGWKVLESHLKTVEPSGRKHDYSSAVAGSFPVESGTTNFVKRENAEVVMFPVGAIDLMPFPKNLTIQRNYGSGTMFSIYSNSPCWLAYASSSGKISIN